jgi:hypothetical protein
MAGMSVGRPCAEIGRPVAAASVTLVMSVARRRIASPVAASKFP